MNVASTFGVSFLNSPDAQRASRFCQEKRMPEKTTEGDQLPIQDRQHEYMKGGKGRRDEVGRSGIYPMSSPDAPADAEVRTEAGLATHKGAPQKPSNEQVIKPA